METIPVKELELLDRSFDVFSHKSFPSPSLLSEGLYTPLPVAGDDLVWGFHLIALAEQLRISELNCMRIDARAKGELLAYALAIEDRAGRYGWGELDPILGLVSLSECSAPPLSHLLFGDSPKNGIEKLSAFAELPEHGKKLVKQLGLDVKTASAACTLVKEAAIHFVSDTRFAKRSASEKRIFIGMCAEIAKREGLSAELQVELIKAALTSDNPDLEIRKKRFPGLSRMYETLDEFRSEHLSGSGIELSPPEYFEGDSFTVSFSFSSKKNLKKKLDGLHSIEERADELLGLL